MERIAEDCGDETDLFLSVRSLNQHPLLLLPPPCCWIPYAIDYVQSHARKTEHTLTRNNSVHNYVTGGSHFPDWTTETYYVCLSTGCGRGVKFCTSQFFLNYAFFTAFDGGSLCLMLLSWQELPQKSRSCHQGAWMPSGEMWKYWMENVFRFVLHESPEKKHKKVIK
jgi:hypothetical protein